MCETGDTWGPMRVVTCKKDHEYQCAETSNACKRGAGLLIISILLQLSLSCGFSQQRRSCREPGRLGNWMMRPGEFNTICLHFSRLQELCDQLYQLMGRPHTNHLCVFASTLPRRLRWPHALGEKNRRTTHWLVPPHRNYDSIAAAWPWRTMTIALYCRTWSKNIEEPSKLEELISKLLPNK